MTVLIVDGTNNFIRNYAAVPTVDNNGEPNGGTIGFLRSLGFFARIVQPSSVIVVWDGPGGSQKRKKILKEYKEGRKPVRLNRMFDTDLDENQNKAKQRIRLAEYLSNLPIYQMAIHGIEADDAIGFLIKFLDGNVVIASNDKDFYQLINDKVKVFSPTKKEIIDKIDVIEEFGVHPNNFALAKAIVGDKSDNIKGLKGIGFKRTVKFFPFLSEEKKIELEQLLEYCKENGENYERFVEEWDIVIRNHKLMQLENPIIGVQNIISIKEKLTKKINFNATAFRIKLLEDGVTTIGDSFFEPFRILYRNKK